MRDMKRPMKELLARDKKKADEGNTGERQEKADINAYSRDLRQD